MRLHRSWRPSTNRLEKLVYLGAAIVTGAGLFVIWRERQLGLQRARAAEGPPQST